MIFSLQFILIFSGYGAVSSLSGNYMSLYTGADEFQLGLYFMIPHFLHSFRLFISAHADRNRSHKRIYTWCALIAALSYLPYTLLPFILKNPTISQVLTNKYRFWILVFFHIIGSVSLNGCRTLADALAKNYARRVNIEYVSMRKFAPVGLGLCAYLFGFFNEEWILPDYVPAMMLFSMCMLSLALLIHVWPDGYFHIVSSEEDEQPDLPSTSEIISRLATRAVQPFKGESSYIKQLKSMTSFQNKGQLGDLTDTKSEISAIEKQKDSGLSKQQAGDNNKSLSLRQQISILGLVLKRDFRITLAFAVLFIGGWICRSAQNFVFVQLQDICETKRTCHPGKLSGNVLAGISLLEFLTYVILSWCKSLRLNRLVLLELAILSISIHYLFFGFFIEYLPTNWFLVESLHGFEFAIFITTSLGWGYSFANEVEFIIPELKDRGVISERDDLNLVKVSLVATMMSSMTFLFEGFGSTLGSFVYGWIIEQYTYSLAWKINGSLALLEFILIFIGLFLNQCLKVEPKMTKLKTESLRAKSSDCQTES